jgi:hypothetical protein
MKYRRNISLFQTPFSLTYACQRLTRACFPHCKNWPTPIHSNTDVTSKCNFINIISVPTRHSRSFNRTSNWKMFLGASAKLRKATIGFVMSVCPHGTTRLTRDGFSWNFILTIFRKYVETIHVSLQSDKNNGYFTWRLVYIFITSRSVLLRIRNILDWICTENQNTFFGH